MASVNEEFKVPTCTARRKLKLLNNPVQSDVHILSKTEEAFFAHSIVLKERSHFLDILKKVFDTEEDTERSQIRIRTDISSETLFALLKFVYIDQLDTSIYYAPELMRVAEVLQLATLRRKCAEFIQKNVDLHNVCELFILAHEHKCSGLKQACLSIIAKNFSMVSRMTGYLQITQNPILLLELAQALSVNNSNAVFSSQHRASINNTPNHNNSPSSTNTSPIQIGKRISISGITGIIKYIGRTNFDGGKNQWVGIEADLPSKLFLSSITYEVGTHDGSINGVRYFQAEQNHGIFVGMWFV